MLEKWFFYGVSDNLVDGDKLPPKPTFLDKTAEKIPLGLFCSPQTNTPLHRAQLFLKSPITFGAGAKMPFISFFPKQAASHLILLW